MVTDIIVTKRSGNTEQLQLAKIHRVLEWASEGLDNVSVSEIELKAQLHFHDGITTEDIHETLIKSAADLITEHNPDYQYLAARLAIFHLRKRVYGGFTPCSLQEQIEKGIELEQYCPSVTQKYTLEEISELNEYIRHERDLDFSYAAVMQLQGKYLIQDRVSKKIYETPQFLYMLVAMYGLAEIQENRLELVKKFYDTVSTFKISLPTPIMAGLRTSVKQFSSCVLISSGDTLDSITSSTTAIVKYISQKAGIGINAGAIRAVGSKVRNGQTSHTGCIPFYKLFQSAVKSCSQGKHTSPLFLEIENA